MQATKPSIILMHGFPDNLLYHRLVQSAFAAWGVEFITRRTQLAKIGINAAVFHFLAQYPF